MSRAAGLAESFDLSAHSFRRRSRPSRRKTLAASVNYLQLKRSVNSFPRLWLACLNTGYTRTMTVKGRVGHLNPPLSV
ncbi:hypothetical protein EB796_025295 [Bugula neritina]|uniref:Uncharacterized protein n=1 Tax=Bugula neritina TaxID=10212 RepID=A0A7J7ISP7_BUGNE|nr:hypothetical protein EB796_025295 [Bugula neritina]